MRNFLNWFIFLVAQSTRNRNNSKRISNGTLVAITLMIAGSRPEEKDVMVKVVVNLINKDN